MRSIIAQIMIEAALVVAVSAADIVPSSLSPREVAEVRRELIAFEKGTASLDDVTARAGERGCAKLVAYYLAQSNAVSTKMKLPISRCFAVLDRYSEAAGIAGEYVSVYSNDWRGWRILGAAHFAAKSYGKALEAYTNAVMLGDEACYAPLAAAALTTERLDLVRDIIPHLLILKRAERTTKGDKLDIVSVLVVYSLKADEKDVFVKALEGVDVKQILSRHDLKENVKLGCKCFKTIETQKLRQSIENNSHSPPESNRP